MHGPMNVRLVIRYDHSSITKCYMLVLKTTGEKWVLKPRHKLRLKQYLKKEGVNSLN